MIDCFITGCKGSLWREPEYRECLLCKTKFPVWIISKAHYDKYVELSSVANWVLV